MVELEDAFINLAFEQGGIEGTTPEDIKGYIRYIADRRLQGINLEPIFGIEKNPLVWLDYMLSGVEHANFFENRATEYAKGSLTGSWNDVWAQSEESSAGFTEDVSDYKAKAEGAVNTASSILAI